MDKQYPKSLQNNEDSEVMPSWSALKGKWKKVKVAQLWPTLRYPMDYSLPGSSVHGILQARLLEWVAIPFSMGASQPRDQTQIFHTAGRFFTIWATREDPLTEGVPLERTLKVHSKRSLAVMKQYTVLLLHFDKA